jgi:hypothetical protein
MAAHLNHAYRNPQRLHHHPHLRQRLSEITYSSGVNGATEAAITGLWAIGGRPSDDLRNFNGKVAQVGVWSRVLTAGEIVNLAAGQAPDLAAATDLEFYFKGNTSSLDDEITSATGTADGTTQLTGGNGKASFTKKATPDNQQAPPPPMMVVRLDRRHFHLYLFSISLIRCGNEHHLKSSLLCTPVSCPSAPPSAPQNVLTIAMRLDPALPPTETPWPHLAVYRKQTSRLGRGS